MEKAWSCLGPLGKGTQPLHIFPEMHSQSCTSVMLQNEPPVCLGDSQLDLLVQLEMLSRESLPCGLQLPACQDHANPLTASTQWVHPPAYAIHISVNYGYVVRSSNNKLTEMSSWFSIWALVVDIWNSVAGKFLGTKITMEQQEGQNEELSLIYFQITSDSHYIQQECRLS